MNTYGDMVTLLLTFFIMLFAFSTLDAERFRAIMASFQGSLGILESGMTVSFRRVGQRSRLPTRANVRAKPARE